MPRRKSNLVRSDGRFRVKYKGRQFYGATYSEAVKKMEEFKRQEAVGLKASAGRMSVRQYALKWLPIHKASVSDKCYNDYAKQINTLIDAIGDLAIMDVKPSDIKEVYSTHYLHYSESTIHRAAMLYKSLFESAKEDGYCTTNPCRSTKAKPHRGTSGTHRSITDEERHLIETVEHRYRTAAMIMLYAGLRRGEVLALDLGKDVDRSSDPPMILVRKAVMFESNQPVITSTKTEAGDRDVPVFDNLMKHLDGASGLALTKLDGSMCSETSFREGWEAYMSALSKAAGHPVSIRPHDLRHSYCTMLRDAGVDMHLAMDWMGHADEKMILQIYDHITPKRVQNAVKNVQKYLLGVQNGVQK